MQKLISELVEIINEHAAINLDPKTSKKLNSKLQKLGINEKIDIYDNYFIIN